MEKFIKILGIAFLFIVLVAIVSFFTGLIVMWLWLWLMPIIFGLPTLTYIQAWGVSFLCGCLFKGSYSQTKND